MGDTSAIAKSAGLKLLVFAPYFPPHVGGLERYINDLNEILLEDSRVEAITVFAPHTTTKEQPLEELNPKHRVIHYPAMELITSFPVPKIWKRDFWRALRKARANEHDVFISHTRFFLCSIFALIHAKAKRKPLLHIEHGSDHPQLSSRHLSLVARFYDHTLGKSLLRHADQVAAVSDAAAIFVKQLSGREAAVVYRGMWLHQLEKIISNQELLERANGKTIITFAGRLVDGKGVHDLLNAFAEIPNSNALLCIVGDGPCRDSLERLADQLGLTQQVLFLGYLSEEETHGVIRASDVVVNPSSTEGLPTSVLEGALMRKAVLASDVGGTREIITDERSGLLYSAEDVPALRHHLEKLLSDPQLRERFGETAYSEAAARFDWHKNAENFSLIITGLARKQEDKSQAQGGIS